MASGKTHNAVTAFLAATTIIFPLPTLVSGSIANQIALTVGTISGKLLGPDLDVDGGNISHRIIRTRSVILWLLWSVFWVAYGQGLKHRSPRSHKPGLGTILRLVYIAAPLSIILWHDQRVGAAWYGRVLVAQFLSLLFFWLPAAICWKVGIGLEIWFWFWLGIAYSDLGHRIMDTKFMKRFT